MTGTFVRVVGGRHRRTDDDGQPEIYERGDVFEATDAELEAFGDKFQEVEEGADGYEPAGAPDRADRGDAEAGTYRLVRGGTHRYVDEDGDDVVLEEGDVADLSVREVEAFGDKFEPVDDGADEEEPPAEDPDDVDGEAEDDVQEEEDVDEEPAEGGDEPEEDDPEEEPEGPIAVPEDYDYELPEDFPDELPDDYRALQTLASANDVPAQQSKADIVDDLEQLLGEEA